MHCSVEKSQTQQPSGFSRLLGGFILAAARPRKKDNLGNNNNFYFHPELKRWVERGKEDNAYKTSELPPPPMTNGGLGAVAPKRRSLAQRYKLQDNLRVSSGVGGDGANVTGPTLPFLPASGTGMFLPSLCQSVDAVLSSGPPSASSDCSLASSSSASTRSNSATSLAGVYSARSSSSTESTCTGPASGAYGEDSAMSQDTVCAELLAAQSPFPGRACPIALDPTAAPSPHTEEVPVKPHSASLASVSTWCSFETGQLAAMGDACAAAAAPSAAPADRESPPVGPQQQAGTASGIYITGDAASTAGPAAATAHEASAAGVDPCGDPAVLSRASSLALSFSDFAHYDSLSDAELSKDQHTQHQVALQSQSSQDLGSQQLKTSPRKISGGAPGPAQPSLCDHSSFSFVPTAAPDSWPSSRDSDKAWSDGGADAVSMTAVRARLSNLYGCEVQQACSSALAVCSPPTEPQLGQEAVQQPARYQQQQPQEPPQQQPQQEQPQQLLVGSHGGLKGQDAGDAAGRRSEELASGAAKVGGVDLAAVDTAVRVLKELRGSLLVAGRCPKVEGYGDAAAGCVTAECRGIPEPTATVGTIGVSFAQAAQTLAGLGLLAPPSGLRPEPTLEDAAVRPVILIAEEASEKTKGKAASPGAPVADAARDEGRGEDGVPTPEARPRRASRPCSAARRAGRGSSSSGIKGAAAAVGTVGGSDSGSGGLTPRDGATGGAERSTAFVAKRSEAAHATSTCPPRVLSLLRKMSADWTAIKGHLAGAYDESAAVVKQVAAVVARQGVMERRCGALRSERSHLAQQLERERAAHAALAQQLERERAQRAALEEQLECERAQSAALAAAQGQIAAAAAAAAGCYSGCDAQGAGAEAVELRADIDELLLCLGQESSKVAVLADALRAAGVDPDSMIEQVEAEFVAKGAGACGSD